MGGGGEWGTTRAPETSIAPAKTASDKHRKGGFFIAGLRAQCIQFDATPPSDVAAKPRNSHNGGSSLGEFECPQGTSSSSPSTHPKLHIKILNSWKVLLLGQYASWLNTYIL